MSETKEEASLSYYDFQEDFTAHEVACLIVGLDPDGWDAAKGGPYERKVSVILEAMFKAYERTCNTAERAARQCVETKSSIPGEVWREQKEFLPDQDFWIDWELFCSGTNVRAFEFSPRTLVSPFDDVIFHREDVAAWLRARKYRHACYFWTEEDREREADEARHSPSARVDRSPQQEGADRPLDPRERTTLYSLVLAMAMDGYGYVLDGKPSPIPREISEITERKGLAVSDDTVRSHLKAAAQLLLQSPQES